MRHHARHRRVVRRPPARTADGWAVCSAAGTLEQKGERFIGTNILELDNDPQHRRHRGHRDSFWQPRRHRGHRVLFNSHGGTQSTRRFYVLKCHGGGGVRESFGSSVTKRGAHEDRPGLRSRLATRAAFDGDASSLAALSFLQAFPVFLVVAPCQPGASPISCDAPVHPQAAAAAGSRLHTQAIASARPIRDRRRALEPRHPTSAVPATRRSDSQRALVARFEQGGEPPPPDRRMMSSRVLRQKAESQGRNQSRLFDCHSCLVNCAVPPSRRQARSDGAHQRLAPTRALSAIAEHAL